MADLHGGFKANHPPSLRAVKQWAATPSQRPPAINPNDQKSCTKFSRKSGDA
jgi:hypothetical protein